MAGVRCLKNWRRHSSKLRVKIRSNRGAPYFSIHNQISGTSLFNYTCVILCKWSIATALFKLHSNQKSNLEQVTSTESCLRNGHRCTHRKRRGTQTWRNDSADCWSFGEKVTSSLFFLTNSMFCSTYSYKKIRETVLCESYIHPRITMHLRKK